MIPRTTFALDHVRRPRSVRTRMERPEQEFQASLVRALPTVLGPNIVFFAVPNGGQRSPVEASILKGQGVKAGVPDLIFIHAGKAFGLELKADKGGLSIAQHGMHAELRGAGMRVEVARTVDEAIEHLHEAGIPLRIKKEDLEYRRRKRAA